ncbi:zinc finger BED domain-containing protein RICESLEEPER 4-like [Phaseolus vulgaris]|uniref:zinc finger BED domain-containing protein RICESLEEPER 4-like n=1 Tax=Phaseolus vulgaris TaxID=3885 RepID=UPI0035CC9A52
MNQDLNFEIGMAEEEDINIPECENEIEKDDFENQSETIEGDKKKRDKTTTSDCWKYFTKIGVDKDGKERARCNSCNRIYLTGGRKYGTSHLNRHIMKCDKRKTEDVGQMILDMQGKLKGKKIDQVVHRELLSNLIIRHNLPYKFVEYPELRTWIRYLCPDAIMISRNTVKADIGRMYIKEKIVLKELLVSIPYRICLTSYLWTSINTEGFISLTAHFVDLN